MSSAPGGLRAWARRSPRLHAAWRALRGGARRKREGELAFWRQIAASGSLSNAHYEALFTAQFGIARDWYHGKRMLDLGCGPQGSLEWAAEAAERVGLDPLVGDYRELGIDGHAMRYVEAPAEAIPFPDGHFDVVSAFNSLDHVDQLGRTLAEVERVLRPGGTFLVVVEVGHDPRWEEPQRLDWDSIERAAPRLRPMSVERFELADGGIYGSLAAAIPFDDRDARVRPGLLKARYERERT
jgi:SAM-dependent methyltransferase